MKKKQVSPVFLKNYLSTKEVIINRGGSSGGKTYSILQLIAKWLLTGEMRQGEIVSSGVCSVVRKTLPALKKSGLRDFKNILAAWGKFGASGKGQVTYRAQDNEFKFGKRTVEFFGLDKPQKARGPRRQFLYMIEANEFTYEDYFQLEIRTQFCTFMCFNPSDPYIWIKEVLEDKTAIEDETVQTIISTYLDNPFLPEKQAKGIANIKDPELRKVYTLGQYGLVKGLIFPNVEIVKEMPKQLKKSGGGLDFGYTNDPTALVHCGLHRGKLYLNELIYDTGLSNRNIADLIKSTQLRDAVIYADSAEPKSIDEINRAGLFVKPTKKGADSIRYGINLIKQYPICITSSSINLIREHKKYKWLTTTDGQPTNKPMDDFNHAWDAVRYWAMMSLGRGKAVQAFG